MLDYAPGQHQAFVDSRDDNSYHVVSAPDGADDDALIDGFWIVHGGTSDITADQSDRRGGAMLITSARPRVLRCVFTENIAAPPPDEPGGALFVDGPNKWETSWEVLTPEPGMDVTEAEEQHDGPSNMYLSDHVGSGADITFDPTGYTVVSGGPDATRGHHLRRAWLSPRRGARM